MNETPFYITGDHRPRIFAIHHEPIGSGSDEGFVFCHPFAEEKLWAHRVYVSFARLLASKGCSVLRFDSAGYGDSDGEFNDSDVDIYLDDIGHAIRELKNRAPDLSRISLLGLRLGAMYAALAAERHADIYRLILWEPVVDGDKYMQEVLRSCLTTQLSVYGKITKNRKELIDELNHGSPINVDGYELGKRMFDQISGLKIGCSESKYKGRTLVVQIGKDGQKIRKEYDELGGSYTNSEIVLSCEEPFWREIRAFYASAPDLFDKTAAWLGVL